MDIQHTLSFAGGYLESEVEACANEVAGLLADYSLWPSPILPGNTQCDRMNVIPQYFDVIGSYWNCNNQATGDYIKSLGDA